MTCSHNNSNCCCGEAVYSSLPTAVTLMECICESPEWKSFSLVGVNRTGYYCNVCGNLHRYALANNYFVCEGCHKYFIWDYRAMEPINLGQRKLTYIKWPPPNILCKKCNIPTKTRRRRVGTVRFN